MTVYYKYRIHCSTDNKDEYWVLSEDESAPTTCPTDTAHTVIASSVSIVEIIEKNLVEINEEKGVTGGSFGIYSKKMTCPTDTTTSITEWWPYPITALNINFITNSAHINDELTLLVGENTNVGGLTSNVAPAVAWVSQNYTVGQIVTHTHSTLGSRSYTCIQNTVSSENPENNNYWKHGFELSVTSTVIENTSTGYFINLYDGTNTNDMQRVISVDKTNSKIYVETNLTNSFNYSTTYIRQTIYLMRDLVIGEPGAYNFGYSKIKGSYIPADVIIKISYKNKSITDAKTITGRIEYIY